MIGDFCRNAQKIMHISNSGHFRCRLGTLLRVFCGISVRVLVPDSHTAAQRRAFED
jgi:hypothetical protein